MITSHNLYCSLNNLSYKRYTVCSFGAPKRATPTASSTSFCMATVWCGWSLRNSGHTDLHSLCCGWPPSQGKQM